MNFPSHSIATALGDLTPEFLCSEIDDSKSWGEIWHHFSNQMYKFCHPPFNLGDGQHNPDIPLLGTMKELPPRNWNQHFCRCVNALLSPSLPQNRSKGRFSEFVPWVMSEHENSGNISNFRCASSVVYATARKIQLDPVIDRRSRTFWAYVLT